MSKFTGQASRDEQGQQICFDNIPIGYQSFDENGDLIDVNYAWCRILGYSRDEVLGRNFGEFLPPEDQASFGENFEHCKAAGEMPETQLRLLHKDGSTVFVKFNGEIAYNDDGSFRQTHCTLTDITDLKLTEAMLLESERKYRTLFELAGNAVLLIDLSNGKIVDFNEQACKNLGYSREEFEKLSIFDIEALESSEETQKHIKKFLEEGADQFETRHIAKTGELRDVLVSAKLINLNDKDYSLNIFHDITERKRDEHSIRQQAKIIDQTHDSIVSTDLDGVVTSWNNGSERLFGYTDDEMIGEHISSVYPEEEHSFLLNEIIGTLRAKGAHEAEVRLRRKSGEDFYAHLSLSMLYDKYGVATGMIGYSMDITERKKAEAELQRVSLAASASVSGIAVADTQGIVTYVNESFVRLWGYDYAREVIGLHINKLSLQQMEPDAAVMELRGSNRSVIGGRTIKEMVGIRKDGSKFDVEVHARMVTSDESNPEMIVSSFFDITERKKSKEALRQNKEELDRIFNLSPDMVGYGDLQGNFTKVNHAFYLVLGHDEAEFLRKPFMDFVHPDDVGATGAALKDANEGITRLTVDNRYRCKDGTYKWISWSVVCEKSKNEFLAVGRDITKRKAIEEALRETSELNKNIFDESPIGLTIYNHTGQCIAANESIAEMLGATREKVIGLNYNNLESWKRSGLLEAANRSILTQEKERHELKLVTTFGKKAIFDCLIVPFVSNGEQHLLIMLDDITERKKNADALRESEEKYRTITETSVDAIYQLNAEGDILFMNEAGARMWGYSLESINNMHFTELVDEARIPATAKLFERILTGESIQGEIFVKHKDGHEFPVFYSIAPQKKNGEIIGFTGITQDITNRKKAEAEAHNIDKLRSVGVLAGGIAHDFNNILGAVLGNITLAMDDLNPASEPYDTLQKAENATLRAAELTKRFLTFSKGGTPIKEKTDISSVIKDCMEFVLSGSKSKCIFDFTDDLNSVEIDAGQIGQLFQNLATNAKDAMPDGGIVKVFSENYTFVPDNDLKLRPGKYVHITVTDNGEGIPEDIIDKVFDPFFTTKFEGSGIGLAAAYSIVDKHDGHIEVSSIVGEGTTFDIYIPSMPLSEGFKTSDAAELTNDEPTTYDQTKGRILVMDDEVIMRDLATRILARAGYEVECAANTPEVVKMFKAARAEEKPYDLVILDLTIPGESGGREAVLLLKEIEPDLKVIVFSGYADDPVMSNCEKYGFCEAIKKPFAVDVLTQVVRKHIATAKP